MFRDNVDVYIDGQLRARRGTIVCQGGEIRITGEMTPLRFQQATLHKDTGGTLAYDAVDAATGRSVNIAALSSTGCGGCANK